MAKFQGEVFEGYSSVPKRKDKSTRIVGDTFWNGVKLSILSPTCYFSVFYNFFYKPYTDLSIKGVALCDDKMTKHLHE